MTQCTEIKLHPETKKTCTPWDKIGPVQLEDQS